MCTHLYYHHRYHPHHTLTLNWTVPPKITPFDFANDLNVNDRTSVQCVVATGDLPLNFTWLKDGLPLRITSSAATGSTAAGFSIRQNDEFTSALSITNIMVADAGSYTCRVQNDAATVEHVAPLSVNGNHQQLRHNCTFLCH